MYTKRTFLHSEAVLQRFEGTKVDLSEVERLLGTYLASAGDRNGGRVSRKRPLTETNANGSFQKC